MQEEETTLTTAKLECVQEFKWTKVKQGTKFKVIPTTTYSITTSNDLATSPIIANEPTLPIPTVPPNTPAHNTERRRTPYERIQRNRELRKANRADREETKLFFDAAIATAEDKRTKRAKAADNPCPFKEAAQTSDVLQPRREQCNSLSILRSAKNIGYSINRAFCRAIRFVKHGLDSHLVQFRHNIMLATYNDREISGPIKIWHTPAPILRTPKAPQSLIHRCQGRSNNIGGPNAQPSALKEPTLIPLPSKEYLPCCLIEGFWQFKRTRIKKAFECSHRMTGGSG